MRAMTKNFGEIEIADDKIIVFDKGIIGFPELREFALIYNEDRGSNGGSIRWLQSMNRGDFAMPVMDPLVVDPSYNPQVDDELLKPLGEMNPYAMVVLVTVTVPKDIKYITVNLKAPIVINGCNSAAAQLIVDGDEYKVKFPIYDILQMRKAEGKVSEQGGV